MELPSTGRIRVLRFRRQGDRLSGTLQRKFPFPSHAGLNFTKILDGEIVWQKGPKAIGGTELVSGTYFRPTNISFSPTAGNQVTPA